MCSDAWGHRYAAATVSDHSRPRPAPHSSTARYRRPTTRRCGYPHTRGPLQQHLPLPPRSAYFARRWLRGHKAGVPLCPPAHPLASPYHRRLIHQPQPPPTARQCASPPANKSASPPARVLDHTPAQPLQPPLVRLRTCVHAHAAAYATAGLQATSPPVYLSRLLAWVAAFVHTRWLPAPCIQGCIQGMLFVSITEGRH